MAPGTYACGFKTTASGTASARIYRVSTTKWTLGIYTGGSYNVIEGNHVHHTANAIACSSAGGSAAIHPWHDAANLRIINNTVNASNFGIIVGGGDYYFTSAGANNNCGIA